MASRRKPSGRPPPGTRRPAPASNRISNLAQQLQSTNITPNISYTPIFSTAPPRQPPPGQPTPSDWESYTPSQREKSKAKHGSNYLKHGINGKGGGGSADLYRKIGFPEGTEEIPEYIVVKQAERSDKDLLSESLLLQLCMDRNTPHVLKIYRGYHEGEAVPRNIGGMFEVGRENFRKRQKRVASRIYLEFCEKGDVEGWTTDHVEKAGIILEEQVIWNMFECLAQACMILENGDENSENTDRRNWIPICHLDLKPANILIGNKDDNHHDVGIFKMGDLGLSAHVPENPQDPGWLAYVAENLTLGWGAPEQFFPQMPNRSYNTPANVFGIAAIIYYVMTKQRIEVGQGMAYVGFPSLDNEPHMTIRPPVLTCGRKLLDDPTINNTGIYSKTLIRTLLQCLAYSPNERMTAKQLLDVCTTGRFLFDNVLEKYTYESSQASTNYWPDRAAIPKGIPGYVDTKDSLKYYPTHESIAAAKEREERFLESFWVTPPKQIVPPASVFTNPFNSGTGLGSSASAAFSFGQSPSSSQFNHSNIFKPENDPDGNPGSGSGFMFGK